MLLSIIKNFMIVIKEPFGRALVLSRLQSKNPTCHFYPGINVDNSSSLGKYNVIFRNTSIVDSTFGDHTFIQKESVVNDSDVGKFCSIAMHVNIGLTQHAISYVSTHPAFYLLNTPLIKIFSKRDMFQTTKRTVIGHDVWIGQNSMVMGGVTIGTGAIIAAGSVVTRDIEPYAIAGGVPARVIKYRFDPETIQALLGSRWWEAPDEELEKIHHLSADPLAFLNALRSGHE